MKVVEVKSGEERKRVEWSEVEGGAERKAEWSVFVLGWKGRRWWNGKCGGKWRLR
jgi:hypothetical protein